MPKVIILAHLLAAIFSSWRLTELVMTDQISAPLRKRFPWYIFTCIRCLSVWAGVVAVAIFYFYPWANWPFALSWLYIQHIDWALQRAEERKRKQDGRLLVVSINNDKQMSFLRNELAAEELQVLSGFIGKQWHVSASISGPI